MAKDRTSYQRQYYRKQVIWSQKKTIKNLREDKKKFMESPEGIAYKKRLLKESGYHEKYNIENNECCNLLVPLRTREERKKIEFFRNKELKKMKEYREKNKEKIRAYQKEYHLEYAKI